MTLFPDLLLTSLTEADNWIALPRYQSQLRCQQGLPCYLKAVFSFSWTIILFSDACFDPAEFKWWLTTWSKWKINETNLFTRWGFIPLLHDHFKNHKGIWLIKPSNYKTLQLTRMKKESWASCRERWVIKALVFTDN